MTADRLGTIDLPELPGCAGAFHVQHFRDCPSMRNVEFSETSDFGQGTHPLYTAAQMQEYARAAIAALTPAADPSVGAAWAFVSEVAESARTPVEFVLLARELLNQRHTAAPAPSPASGWVLPAGWRTLAVGDGSGRLFVHGPYDAIKAAQRHILATPPALSAPPPADAVRALAEKWRNEAAEMRSEGSGRLAEEREYCADELEAALTAAPAACRCNYSGGDRGCAACNEAQQEGGRHAWRD